MKTTFEKFKKLLFESILFEDKSRLIDRLVLPDIENEEEKQKARDEMKAFFKKYNTWENKLDWNKLKTITYSDFEKIKDMATKTKGAQKREIATGDIRSIFKSIGVRLFEIVGENDDWLFVSPLTWEAAVYCDSSENQGAGAKWCIGYEKSESSWEIYTGSGSLFIMAFNKNYKSLSSEELQTNLKFMIEQASGRIDVYNQADQRYKFGDTKSLPDFGVSLSEMKSMFKKTSIAMKNSKKLLNKILYSDIVVPKIEKLKELEEIPSQYFSNKEKLLVKSIHITGKTKRIGNSAFEFCENLENVIIDEGVQLIDNFAFYNCENLKKIKIPNSVVKLNPMVFSDCSSLKEVILPNNLTELQHNTFDGCYELSDIKLPDTLTMIDEACFQSCKSLERLEIPSSVKTIGRSAFSGCSGLQSIIFKNKTLDKVRKMKNYPWGINESKARKIIKVEQ